jgi:hypothetical protein
MHVPPRYRYRTEGLDQMDPHGRFGAETTEGPLMHKFKVGQPVMDREDGDDVGHVDDLRADGWLRIIWASGRHEWVHADDIELAPGFKPKPRPR